MRENCVKLQVGPTFTTHADEELFYRRRMTKVRMGKNIIEVFTYQLNYLFLLIFDHQMQIDQAVAGFHYMLQKSLDFSKDHILRSTELQTGKRCSTTKLCEWVDEPLLSFFCI